MPQEKTLETKVEARAYPIAEPKGNTVAFASVTIDDKFAVNGLRVVSGEKGPFVAMPQTRDAKGEWRDLAFPTTAALRKEISDTVLTEYAAALDELVAKRESTVDKLREAAKAAKDRPAPATNKEKAAHRSAGAEL